MNYILIRHDKRGIQQPQETTKAILKDKCKIGVYGYFEFSTKKLLYGSYHIMGFKMYGEIIKIDEDACIIEDCYQQKYRIVWSRLKKFEKMEKPDEK